MDIPRTVISNQRVLPPRTDNAKTPAELEVVAKASEVAQEFESIFLGMMLKSMRAAVPEGGLMDSGQGGKVFEEMLDTEYAKMMSKQGMSDLAKNIASEMLKSIANQQGLADKIKGLQNYDAQQKAQMKTQSLY